MSTTCRICDGPTVECEPHYDDRYGYPGVHPMRRCTACGHRSLQISMSPDELSDLYTHYYPRSSFDVESWRPPAPASPLKTWWRGLRSSAFRWVPENVRVLDVGCGFGESLGYHRARGCDAHGVEADRNILRVAQRHGLNVRSGLFDERNYAPASFDVATLDQVIEHVADPVPVLQGLGRVLKPGGLLVLSTPNAEGWGARLFGRRWIHWHTPYHLQFFTERSMQRSAARAGFRIERLVTVSNSSWLDYQWGHVLTFPRAGEPSVYWNPARPRALAQRIGLRLLRWLDNTGINTLLTRLFDSLSLGDNRVYLLRKT